MELLTIMLALLITLLMLGLGSTLTIENFKESIKNWRAPLVGFLCQVIFMPLFAFAVAKVMNLDNQIALSIVAIGSTPGGSTSNLFTKWSQGDLSLSITMTVISSFLSFGTLPLLLYIYASPFTSDSFKIDYGAILQSLVLVVIPVAIGVSVRRCSIKVARWMEVGASAAGVLFIVAAIIYGTITEASIFTAPAGSFAAAVLLMPAGAGFGYGVSVLLGLTRRQARTVALETGIQNATLIIAILVLSFPATDDDPESQHTQDKVLQFPLLYSLFLIIDAVLITLFFLWVSKFDPPHEKEAYEAHERMLREAEERRVAGKQDGGAAEDDGMEGEEAPGGEVPVQEVDEGVTPLPDGALAGQSTIASAGKQEVDEDDEEGGPPAAVLEMVSPKV